MGRLYRLLNLFFRRISGRSLLPWSGSGGFKPIRLNEFIDRSRNGNESFLKRIPVFKAGGSEGNDLSSFGSSGGRCSVEGVADNGMPGGSQMNTYLVSAAGRGPGLDECLAGQ